MALNKKYLKRLGIRFGALVLIHIVFFTLTGAISYTESYLYKFTNDSFDWAYTPEYNETEFNIIFDQHSHTKYSDGVLTFEQNILWHLAHGFNAMALTDHNRIPDPVELANLAATYAGRILLLSGEEWTTNRIHLNLLGISEFVPIPSSNPTNDEIQEAIDATHTQGGVVVVNHIPWSTILSDPLRMPDHPSRVELLAWGVDYIELVNENVYDYESDPWCNDTNGFGNITGTDMHHPMNVYGWTFMKTSSFTTAAVMEQLVARNNTILYDEVGSTDHAIGTKKALLVLLEPMIEIGEYFLDLNAAGINLVNWSGVGIGFAYCCIIFGSVEVIRYGIYKKRLLKKDEDIKTDEK
ncbi:MAG: PHP domain-containing protein [Asgard group archaeon]|nr:PHP domain-containing protein [Asgard group archaeon]